MKTGYPNIFRLGLVLAGIALLPLVASAQNESPNTILDKAHERLVHARTYQAVWQVDMSGVMKSDTSKTGDPVSASLRLEVKWADKKFRLEGDVKGVAADTKDIESDALLKDIFSTGIRALMVSDGHIGYSVTIGASKGVYKKLLAAKKPVFFEVLVGHYINSANSNCILLPSVVLDGRSTYVIEAAESDDPSSMETYYIDQETYRLEKAAITSAKQDGLGQIAFVIQDEKLDALIPDDVRHLWECMRIKKLRQKRSIPSPCWQA